MTSEPIRHPLLAAVDHGFGRRGAPTPADLRRPRQVHGAVVVDAETCRPEAAPAADAVLAVGPGVAVAVVTADCVPILAAAAGGAGVAAIHAGWRGLAQGVIEAGIGALARAAPGDLVAVLGPHIGPCCYEVDEPVLAALRERHRAALDAAVTPTRPGHVRLDLGHLAREALRAAGVPADAIGHVPDGCTACDPERFHSYRRDGSRAGRLVHYVRSARVKA